MINKRVFQAKFMIYPNGINPGDWRITRSRRCNSNILHNFQRPNYNSIRIHIYNRYRRGMLYHLVAQGISISEWSELATIRTSARKGKKWR